MIVEPVRASVRSRWLAVSLTIALSPSGVGTRIIATPSGSNTRDRAAIVDRKIRARPRSPSRSSVVPFAPSLAGPPRVAELRDQRRAADDHLGRTDRRAARLAGAHRRDHRRSIVHFDHRRRSGRWLLGLRLTPPSSGSRHETTNGHGGGGSITRCAEYPARSRFAIGGRAVLRRGGREDPVAQKLQSRCCWRSAVAHPPRTPPPHRDDAAALRLGDAGPVAATPGSPARAARPRGVAVAQRGPVMPAFRAARKAEAREDWAGVVAACTQALAADPTQPRSRVAARGRATRSSASSMR